MPSTVDKLIIAQVNKAIADNVTATIRRQYYRMSRGLTNGIVSAYSGGTVGATNGVKAFAVGIKNNFANPKDLEEAHREVAGMMRESVRRSFGQTVKSKPGHYRVGEGKRTSGGFLSRYSGGSLKRAISADSLAVGDAFGINFVDEGRLTREAAHWARLNFGAKGLSVRGRKRTFYKFRFDDAVVGSIGFDVDSRPAFSVPPGRWVTPEGKRVAPNAGRKGMDRFFPGRFNSDTFVEPLLKRKGPDGLPQTGYRRRKTGLKRVKTASGIEPREFFNAGLRTMSRELPIRYERMLDKWYRDAKQSAKLPSRIRVPAIRGANGRYVSQS